jgi:hypothetical protein
MWHLIEFSKAFAADVEISPRDRLERIKIRKGTQVRARLMPAVIETEHGPCEVADLFFEDGFITRGIPYDHFRFVDEAPDA